MKPLIVYYSYSGITKRLAEDIALITDGDLRELKPERPYSFSYNTAVKEAGEEIEKGYCPPLILGKVFHSSNGGKMFKSTLICGMITLSHENTSFMLGFSEFSIPCFHDFFNTYSLYI